MTSHPYEHGLERNAANYTPLTPVSFLAKAAHVYPERTAIIHGAVRRTWVEVFERSRRLASALAKRGVKRGETVGAMLPNVPAMIELHFGPAMFGAVLNTLNTRLDAEAIAFMLDHGEARVLFTDREFSGIVSAALGRVKRRPLVIDVNDVLYDGPGAALGEIEYAEFIARGDPQFEWSMPPDEWNAIALHYPSGTSGIPKGVVYHYRGAYLNALNNILDWSMPKHPVYLWTLPMFHCNGWCFNWTIAAAAGTNVCLRKVEAKLILELIRDHKVTHYCGAPIVHSMLVNAPAEWHRARGACAGGRRAPARGDDRGHGQDRLRHHARLRPYRDLWAGGGVRQARRMERPSPRGAGAAQRPARRGLPPRGGHERPRSRDPPPGAARWRDHGRVHGPRQHPHEGLPQESRRDRGVVPRRLLPLRRPGGDAPRRLREDQGPLQGRDHLRRREHLVAGSRGCAARAPLGDDGRGGGAARPQMGRDAVRFHRAEGGRLRERGGDHRVLPRAHGALQGAQDGGVRHIAEDVRRQDPEIHPARARE